MWAFPGTLLGMWTFLAPLIVLLSGVLANVNDEVSNLSFARVLLLSDQSDLSDQRFVHLYLTSQHGQMEVHGDLAKTKTHLVDSLDLLIYLLLLFLTILTLWVVKRKRVMFLHESGLSVLIGLVVGAILRFTGRPNSALKVFVSSFKPDAMTCNLHGN